MKYDHLYKLCAEFEQLATEPEISAKLTHIPDNIKLHSKQGWVHDPMDIIIHALTVGEKWPSISMYTLSIEDGDYVAGIDFALINHLPSNKHTGQWYWPAQTTSINDFHKENPRYDNLRDAVIMSLKMHPDAVYIWTKDRGSFSSLDFAGLRIRDWFDNEEYTMPGTVEKWWTDWVSKLQTHSAPVLWKGSDDPMT